MPATHGNHESSVITSLRSLADLEEQRVAEEAREAAEVTAARARREAEEVAAAERRQQAQEAAAALRQATALARARLEQEAEERCAERERVTEVESDARLEEARAAARTRLREADLALAAEARRAGGWRTALGLLHLTLTVSLGATLAMQVRPRPDQDRKVASLEWALAAARSELDARRQDAPTFPAVALAPLPSAPMQGVPALPVAPPSPVHGVPPRGPSKPPAAPTPTLTSTACNPLDPLCATLPGSRP